MASSSSEVPASTTPVTAKIRLGCTRNSMNAIEIAQVVEESGASALTVHGRTAEDYFKGSALFVFMALYWFYTTIKGLQAVLRKEILMHKIWMIRSYSMAMTAVTFRIYHLLFYSIGWGHLENYEISLWISVLGNILFAECFIYNKNQSYLKSKTVEFKKVEKDGSVEVN